MTKQKTRIFVDPISPSAKIRFDKLMHKIHICKVDLESSDEFYLSSANQNYCFVVQKKNDPNWKILK